MKKENASHPVQIVLRDWTKAKKRNRPVAETHTKETKKKRPQNRKLLFCMSMETKH